jgi:hypothetical protein
LRNKRRKSTEYPIRNITSKYKPRSKSLSILPSQKRSFSDFIKGRRIPNVYELQGDSESNIEHVEIPLPNVRYVSDNYKEFESEGVMLKYRTYKHVDENTCILTYISDYSEEFNDILNNIYNTCIIPAYQSNILMYTNRCGENSDKLCTIIKNKYNTNDSIKSGKILMVTSKYINVPFADSIIQIKRINDVYGMNTGTINVSYHALTYIIIKCLDNEYYVEIETTIKFPYNVQYYVGTSPDELRTILMARYLYLYVVYTFRCNKTWYEIYNGATEDTNILSEHKIEVGKNMIVIKGGTKKTQRKKRTHKYKNKLQSRQKRF